MHAATGMAKEVAKGLMEIAKEAKEHSLSQAKIEKDPTISLILEGKAAAYNHMELVAMKVIQGL